MRILITNDDSVNAEGLYVLRDVAQEISNAVTIVAPEHDQSGVAHAVSLMNPLRLRNQSKNVHALSGTPADCISASIGLFLSSEKPELILSGVNSGMNITEDVTYSGTVGGAMEGAINGILSIALSQAHPPSEPANISYECARAHSKNVIQQIIACNSPPGTFFNVNFPACKPSEVAGVETTFQGRREELTFKARQGFDGRGLPYYWLESRRQRAEDPEKGSDEWALRHNRISITPLRFNLTDEPALSALANHFVL